jgi:MFS family permease
MNTSVGNGNSHDFHLLFATRAGRMFAYGFLSVVLVLYLKELGWSDSEAGWLLTLTLLGDTALSLALTSVADRVGRRCVLLVGSALMLLAAGVFAATQDFFWLVAAATIGVISPSGTEVGPFLSIEQAALSQLLPAQQRTATFAWYNLIGSCTTALGSLIGGLLVWTLLQSGVAGADAYRPVIWGYGLIGFLLAAGFSLLSDQVEVPRAQSATRLPWIGLHRSTGTVLRLSALFAVDSFAGGFIVQSVLAYWFHLRHGASPAALGAIFLGGNVFAGFSALAAAWLAQRIGLIKTMVFTHLPSNVLLMLVPWMPTLESAVAVLLMRFTISQMDVPARQSYVMAVVSPEERSAAAGVTAMARSLGAACAPGMAMALVGQPGYSDALFYICGGLKIVYDLTLYVLFVSVKPPEERMQNG